ncbi:hypothetical protein BB561_004244 [Smittium simulii]|uniref:Helicase ATP-binding domain-containing protein n=1 Tax=Smittium simulii TaxID=133385 RepID=A0A2T9YHD0_9FUNG|nr:hypothetical protein BB561_004244 [Smittium simulii]
MLNLIELITSESDSSIDSSSSTSETTRLSKKLPNQLSEHGCSYTEPIDIDDNNSIEAFNQKILIQIEESPVSKDPKTRIDPHSLIYLGGIEAVIKNFDASNFEISKCPFIYYPVKVSLKANSNNIISISDLETNLEYGVVETEYSNIVYNLILTNQISVSGAFYCDKIEINAPILISCYSHNPNFSAVFDSLKGIASFSTSFPPIGLFDQTSSKEYSKGVYQKKFDSNIFSNALHEENDFDRKMFRNMYFEDLLGKLAIKRSSSDSNYITNSRILNESFQNTSTSSSSSALNNLNYRQFYKKNKVSKLIRSNHDPFNAANQRFSSSCFNLDSNQNHYDWGTQPNNNIISLPNQHSHDLQDSNVSNNIVDKIKSQFSSMTDLPEAEPNSKVLTPMFRHQKQALYFMLHRETPGVDVADNSIDFTKDTSINSTKTWCETKNHTFKNTIIDINKVGKPPSTLGGIIADDMGLGKTLSIISLIVTKSPAFPLGTIVDSEIEDYPSNYKLTRKKTTIKSDSFSDISELKGAYDQIHEKLNTSNPQSSDIVINSNFDYMPSSTSSDEIQEIDSGIFYQVYENKKIKSDKDHIKSSPLTFYNRDEANAHFSLKFRAKKYGGTLIICPVSVVHNWEEQIKLHTSKDTLSIYIYHGSDRNKPSIKLHDFDVVVSTYSVLQHEYTKEVNQLVNYQKNSFIIPENPFCSPLQKIYWDRIVLDEAHVIREKKTWQSKAACTLKSTFRWCLTGTPIQNKLNDLYSLLKFIKFAPLDSWDVWVAHINSLFSVDKEGVTVEKPLHSENVGTQRVQIILQTLCLRRMKSQIDPKTGKSFLTLPPIQELVKSLEFSSKEKALYDSLNQKAGDEFKSLVQEGSVLKNYMSILLYILRLRQLCVHPALVDEHYKKDFNTFDNKKKFSTIVKVLTAPELSALHILSKSQAIVCSICHFDVLLANTVEKFVLSIFDCLHMCCYNCLKTLDSTRCPECYKHLDLETRSYNITRSHYKKLQKLAQKHNDDYENFAKLIEQELIYKNKNLKLNNSAASNKSTTDMSNELNINSSTKVNALVNDLSKMYITNNQKIYSASAEKSRALGLINLEHCRLDGKMTRPARNPYWNPMIERQAIDRVHRLGQKNPVTVHRYMIKDTIEEKMEILKKRKELISNVSLMDSERVHNESNSIVKMNSATSYTEQNTIDLTDNDIDYLESVEIDSIQENYENSGIQGPASNRIQQLAFMLS